MNDNFKKGIAYRIRDIVFSSLFFLIFSALGSAIANPGYIWNLEDVIIIDIFVILLVSDKLIDLIYYIKDISEYYPSYPPQYYLPFDGE